MTNAASKSCGDVNGKLHTGQLELAGQTERIINSSPIGEFFKFGERCNAELVEYVETIWKPFEELTFRDATSRGGVVAAILTASIRHWLPRAPGFAILGKECGVGRTQIATAICKLAGGRTVVPGRVRRQHVLDGSTMDQLRAGCDAFIIDNIQATFELGALETVLALETITTRAPHEEAAANIFTRFMVLITGNFTVNADVHRRLVGIHLVAPDAYPERRRLITRQHCEQHRETMIRAAYGIIGAFLAEGAPRFTNDHRVYECWDDLIRQCVLWLNAKGIAELGDPLANTSSL